ncbi:hypothetical protein [Haematobacter missouriensis]|uniref:Uncharacterized protein n=1 Tax=Haematobacter missouriensis TaxID=366616 RepID=A0A225CZ29_9RHOB|nr:hypothetical protein [Haematobacter missouriensis]OWJ70435.1 hypothetical protein CDV53_20635 [Haematobacter missouriensis]OWJ81116.1 hypothetical protein CDV52_19470 [Haematobacter missouriensis]
MTPATSADPEARLFDAITRAATGLGPDHPLALAIARAKADPAPESMAAVHAALETLPAAERDRILAEAHHAMRMDLSAIWSLLPGAAQAGGIQ